jgi:RNA polymerase sigma factor (sigma-70 family)
MNKNLSDKAQHDYELVQLAIKNKDQRAYTELMDRYWDSVFYLLLKMISDKDNAEDLAMETFGKAFRHLDQYTPEFGAFSTWLFKIATNNCIDHIRKQKMTMFSIDQPAISEEGEPIKIDIESPVPDPEEEFIREQKSRIMHKLVAKVKPPRYRKLIELRYFQEMSYEEIAAEAKIPLGTVKAQLFRAKELLFEIISKTNTRDNL